MRYICPIFTLLFGVAVVLFFGMAYPHHLHYQEQFQLFLFDSTYLWDVVKHPGGVADLLGRFCTQFFLYAWVGAVIIGVLLVLVQLLTFQLVQWSMVNGQYSMFNAFSFVPSFLLWLFLLDENALMGGVWAVLFLLLAVWGVAKSPKGWKRYTLFVIAIALLYLIASPTGHYYRNPVETPTLLWAAYLSAIILPLLAHVFQKRSHFTFHSSLFTFYFSLFTSAVVAGVMGTFVWKNANFKAEKVMQYDFMARHQQWNRILNTINTEKPNNQIGVVVQNLALAMNGLLVEHLFDFNQNGDLGLLPVWLSARCLRHRRRFLTTRRVADAISGWHRPISFLAMMMWHVNTSKHFRRRSSIVNGPMKHYRCWVTSRQLPNIQNTDDCAR